MKYVLAQAFSVRRNADGILFTNNKTYLEVSTQHRLHESHYLHKLFYKEIFTPMVRSTHLLLP